MSSFALDLIGTVRRDSSTCYDIKRNLAGRNMDKRFLSILAVLVIIFGGIFVVSQNSSNGTTKNNTSSGSQATNHVQGENAKNVTFLEYGDYECPICGAYYQPLKQAMTPDLLKNIHFQFRNLPLTSIHPNAFAGARAAEAAGLQGKYFEMHDKLYDNQDPSGKAGWVASSDVLNKYFVTFAQQLGLKVDQFKKDYSSGAVNDAVNADMNEFTKTKQQQATPTFFINGKYVANSEFSDPSTGAPSAEKITQVINDAIAKQANKK
jgi:protein-disulfide isomerase